MFQIGDIVLYRLLLAQIEHIEERNGIKYYHLASLESENCCYDVPVQNRLQHLRTLPSKEEALALLDLLPSLPTVSITRNAVDRSCKNILDQYDVKPWLSLLKTLFIDKTHAETAGKKFVESEKRYYRIIFARMSIILSVAMHEERSIVEQQLLTSLERSIR